MSTVIDLGIVTSPVGDRAHRVVDPLTFRPQPDDQLRRQPRKEAPRQGIIDIPVDHVDDRSPPSVVPLMAGYSIPGTDTTLGNRNLTLSVDTVADLPGVEVHW